MEKVELTPVELMQALNWKKSKVYYWIGQGKFETVQRLDGQKVVISLEDIERLKKTDNQENFEKYETVEEISNNSENFQQNLNQNITKNYKSVQTFSNSEAYELFNKSLETIERIHQAALSNFGYTTKLLTDSKSEAQEENLELRAEIKTVQARLEKSEKEYQESLKKSENEKMENLEHFEKVSKQKNLIIFGLIFVLICLIVYIFTFTIGVNNGNSNQFAQPDKIMESVK